MVALVILLKNQLGKARIGDPRTSLHHDISAFFVWHGVKWEGAVLFDANVGAEFIGDLDTREPRRRGET